MFLAGDWFQNDLESAVKVVATSNYRKRSE